MKVKRYPTGQTNLGLLREQRSNINSPGEMAALESAPYDAMAGVAEEATEKLVMFQKERMQEQEKLDRLTSRTDAATLGSDLDVLRSQAETERWEQAEWEERAGALIDGFMEKSQANISSGNQKFYSKVYETNAARYRGMALAAGEKLNYDRKKEGWLAAYDRLGANEDYAGQMLMLDEVGDDEGIKLFEPAVLQQMERLVQGEVESDALMEGYKQAVQDDREDEFLKDLSETDISDETQKSFFNKVKIYDAQTKEIQLEQAKVKAQDMAFFGANITANTTDDQIIAAADKFDVTAHGTVQKWIERRDRLQKADAIVTDDHVDPYEMDNRKAANELVDKGGNTVRERIDTALDVSMALDIVPEYLDGYFNRSVHGEVSDLMIAGEDWIRMHDETSFLPNGVKDEPALRLNLYKNFRMGFESEKAGQMVHAHFQGMDSERREANRRAYNSPSMAAGNQEDKTIRDYVTDRVVTKLEDLAMQGLAEKGFMSNSVPRFPPELMRFIDTAGEHIYANAENEEVVVDTLIQGIVNAGWRVTTVNKGVETGGLEMDAQWQKNPPPRPEIAREEMAEDFAGKQFLVGKEWTTVDPEKVEFWRMVKNPETGRMNWLLRVDGQLIFNEGLQKQSFEYSEVENDGTVEQRTKDLLKRLEEEKAEKIRFREQDKPDTDLLTELY